MDIAVYTLTSPLHDEKATNAVSADFIAGIEERMGFVMDFRGPDFSGYGSHDLDLVFVRTGGTEGLFKEVFPSLEGRIVLLTSGKSNSLSRPVGNHHIVFTGNHTPLFEAFMASVRA